MKLNSDLSKRAVMYSDSLSWVETPMPGVQRRMLERDGGEMASRATTIVRYQADSKFSSHVHDQGEEFIVLDGVFSDESGDYPAGTYVRNPPGSQHRPFTDQGCTIFVKLRQFAANDTNVVRVDTRTAAWLPTETDGQWVMPLYRRDGQAPEFVSLLKWSPEAQIGRSSHFGGQEIFVLEGCFGDENGRYPKGTWLRNPHGSDRSPYTCEGCVLYVKTGHLSTGLENTNEDPLKSST